MSKPGVMMYWNVFDTLEEMAEGDTKTMLRAIRRYAQEGESPEFEPQTLLSIVWKSIRRDIDLDDERYNRAVEQRRNAVNARWEKERANREPENEQPTI